MNDDVSTVPMVYVIDDDAPVRRALARLLRTVGLRMEGFELPQDFLAFERPDVPSCLVLDVRLPGSSGLEFQRELAAARIDVPIIFITGHGDIPMSVRAMKAGAFEFLTKPFRDQDLLDAVQLAVAKDATRRDGERELVALRERVATLTVRERQVMEILITGQLNKQIGAAIGTTESTVKAHRTQVMRKMKAGSLPELVRMVDKLEFEMR
ncbi:MAG TPA: response regulator [Rhizomicrobium sp.]|jgi:FixJ family two-component response regulator|nr:response regulator [Rhizomicrobium sp.]